MRHYDIDYNKELENNFNPRTPYGMRLGITDTMLDIINNFNPRTPYGMRHRKAKRNAKKEDFNPRTPYGMRQFKQIIVLFIGYISIHAPLTGCD